MQQDLGGLRSMVENWNTVVGGLKTDLEALKVTSDRISGMNTLGVVRNELLVLREAVDRNSGWHTTAGMLRNEIATLQDSVERSAVGQLRGEVAALRDTVVRLRSELGVVQAKAERSNQLLQNEFSLLPFAQGTSSLLSG